MPVTAMLVLLYGLSDTSSLADRLDPLVKAHDGKVAVVVQEFGQPVAYSVNADDVKPTASLIKFPIMVEAYAQFAEKKCRPDDLCVYQRDPAVQGSGILVEHFTPGATFSLRDAIRMMIVWSDNMATNIVLDHIGLPATNTRMESLGLPETKINAKVYRRDTSVALERSKKYGLGSTTANEMIKLLTLLHDEKLPGSKEMLGHLLKCEDRDKFPRFLPYESKIAMKTGSVNASRTVAGILYIPKKGSDAKRPQYHEVAVVVLTSDNKDQRWEPDNAGDLLCAKIAKEVYDHYHAKD